jgi:hypothetical protein
MTRLDIADFLSLSIETVSRTFTKFRHDGLIDLTHSTLVTVLDSQQLESLAARRARLSRNWYRAVLSSMFDDARP